MLEPKKGIHELAGNWKIQIGDDTIGIINEVVPDKKAGIIWMKLYEFNFPYDYCRISGININGEEHIAASNLNAVYNSLLETANHIDSNGFQFESIEQFELFIELLKTRLASK